MGRKRARPPAGGRRATWEDRILHGRAGMLRFTPRRAVARTFGIPHGKVEVYHPSSLFPLKRIFDFIERVEHDPERKWLLTHPKIWSYARIRELAPTHGAEDIRKILLEERNNFKDASRRLIPSNQAINRMIKKNGLRTDGSLLTRVRRPVLRKNLRPNNSLSEAERRHLVETSTSMLYQMRHSNLFLEPDLMGFVQSKIASEALRFPFPENMDEAQRAALFGKIVGMKMRNWLKDGLRAVGPYTRSGKPRRPIASSPLAEGKPEPVPVNQTEEIPPALLKKLSPRERIVVEMLLQDAKRTDIARRLHLTGTRVSQIVKKLREKI